MVDTTSGDMHFTLENLADRYYSSTLALMKLRENYATRVSKLPSGVFRRILEI